MICGERGADTRKQRTDDRGQESPCPPPLPSFRIFSFRQRQLAMPDSGAGGMKIPE